MIIHSTVGQTTEKSIFNMADGSHLGFEDHMLASPKLDLKSGSLVLGSSCTVKNSTEYIRYKTQARGIPNEKYCILAPIRAECFQ